MLSGIAGGALHQWPDLYRRRRHAGPQPGDGRPDQPGNGGLCSAKAQGEFGRGWRIVLLALAGAATTASLTLLYGFSTLVLPLQKAFGWSRGDLQVAISFMSPPSN